ncbi:MAG: tetratricopeptide repeat protein [Planctomycetota bacterium]|nr:tetratricopeptide repeat protein [Planctomycetota bacterium]
MRSVWRALLIVPVLCAGTALAGDGAWSHFLKGVKQYEARNIELAEKHFRTALRNDEQLWDAYYYLGLILDKRGESKGARTCLLKLPEERSLYAAAQAKLGQMATVRGKYPDAATHYQASAAKRPSVDAWIEAATACMRAHKYPEAEECLLNCQKLTKGDLRLVENFARLYMETKQWAKAVPHYDKLIEISPRDNAAKFGKAVCLKYGGDKYEAIRLLETILESEPVHIGALKHLIDAYDGKRGKEQVRHKLIGRLEYLKRNPIKKHPPPPRHKNQDRPPMPRMPADEERESK